MYTVSIAMPIISEINTPDIKDHVVSGRRRGVVFSSECIKDTLPIFRKLKEEGYLEVCIFDETGPILW